MQVLPDSLLIWLFKWSKRFWQNSVSLCIELRSIQEKKKILTPPKKMNKKPTKNYIQGIFSPEEQLPSVISPFLSSWWEKAHHWIYHWMDHWIHQSLDPSPLFSIPSCAPLMGMSGWSPPLPQSWSASLLTSRMTKPAAKGSNSPCFSQFVQVHSATACGIPGYW